MNIYKGEVLRLQEEMQAQKEEIEGLYKRNRRQTQASGLNEVRQKCEALEEEVRAKDAEIEALKVKAGSQAEKSEVLERILEKIENELNHEKRKYGSLAQEKGIKEQQMQQGDM